MSEALHNYTSPVQPNHSRPDLKLVSGETLAPVDATEQVAEYIQLLDNEVIPASLDEADEIVKMVETYNTKLGEEITTGKITVEQDWRDTLQDATETGTDMWKLSASAGRDYAAILKAAGPSQLTESAMTYLGNDASNEAFTSLQKQARARIRLSNALIERDNEKNLASLTEKMKSAGFEVDEPKLHSTRAQRQSTTPPSRVKQATSPGDVTVAKAAKAETSKPPAQEAPKRSNGKLELTDLVKFDKDGRPRREDGTSLSKAEVALIADHEAQIRKGLAGLLVTSGLVAHDVNGRARDTRGKYMSNKELASVADHSTEILNSLEELIASRNDLSKPFSQLSNEAKQLINRRQAASRTVKEDGTSQRRPNQLTEAQWAQLSPAERQNVVSYLRDQEPLDTSPAGLKGRVRGIFKKGQKLLTQVYTTVGNKLINPFDKELTERQTTQRKVILSVGIGATLVASAYATYQGLHHMGGGVTAHGLSAQNNHLQNGHLGSGNVVAGHVTPQKLGGFNVGNGSGVGHEATSAHGAVASHKIAETISLHKGDTIFTRATEHLRETGVKHPSMQQRVDEMHHLMRINHIDSEQAKHLAVGKKLKV